MEKWNSRTIALLGNEAIDILSKANILIFGIGGVGGACVEALARSGISNFTLVDKDDVSISNINRQIIALNSTINKSKVELMKDRILDINPNANIKIYKEFYLENNQDFVNFNDYDYVIDCVDTVSAKILIITNANEANVKVISALGAAGKLNPEMLEVSDIYKTEVDPLARILRKELKTRGIKKLKVVYSKETTIKPKIECNNENKFLASMCFVPSTMGIIIAKEVILDLINKTSD